MKFFTALRMVMNNQIAFIRARLQTGEWTFGLGAGKPLTTIMRFAADGCIKGYEHPNEARWDIMHDGLVIYNSKAIPMWKQVRTADDETIILQAVADPGVHFSLRPTIQHNVPLSPARFLFPTDLSVTPAGITRVLLVGSCLTALYYEQFSRLYPDVHFDYIPFNYAGSLPDCPPMGVETYNFQYIQIPLRSILTDRVIWAMRLGTPGFLDQVLEDGYGIMDTMLDSALGYNKVHGLLTFVANFSVPQMNIVLSLAERHGAGDLSQVVRELNAYLARSIRKYNNVVLCDVDALGNSLGKQYFLDDMIYFYSHGASFFQEEWDRAPHNRIEAVPALDTFYESHQSALLAAVYEQAVSTYRTVRQVDQVKAVIFDLDNTLWRGQIAEDYRPDRQPWPRTDGWPLGIWEAIHHLRARGILVAICSKNDMALVRERWESVVQPGFLSLDDFAAIRINWQPKPENIHEICSLFNIKPKNVVFVDDNPVERESVRAALPGIRVIGSNPYLVRRILLWSAETQILHLTDESSRREVMVKGQIAREQVRSSITRTEFLGSLGTEVMISRIANGEDRNLGRVLELTNKTNQFNTTGVRWTNEKVTQFLFGGGLIFTFSVKDKFADYGLVGVVYVQGNTIIQFLMSCRVMGMDIEYFVVDEIVKKIRSASKCKAVNAVMMKTRDNMPCQKLYNSAGFHVAKNKKTDSILFSIKENENCISPSHITLK
ncbi:HAD-IIIC family phosphatase [Komagataeibacter medellinensis]|uniref:HAD-IIIC family phosphatase n=2 Tax=Komagataeibacter medellinensis TaxID=1177712 RepID=A0ABQ6VS40_9PROT|nr:HAD-IIIC family phosphatase [Komagataeibacter medellinensis]